MIENREIEIGRCEKIMHASTVTELSRVYDRVTVGDHLSKLHSDVDSMLSQRDNENLKMMYSLNLAIPDGLQRLRTRIQNAIATEGSQSLAKEMEAIVNVSCNFFDVVTLQTLKRFLEPTIVHDNNSGSP